MTLHDFFTIEWEMLIGRTDGPLSMRFIMQPIMAGIFAIRAGVRDAHEGRTPYLLSVFKNPAHRRYLLHHGWKDVGKVFIVATVLDVIYELVVYRWVYPVHSVIVATVLAIVPYLLIRGPVTRIAQRFLNGSNRDQP